MEKLNLMEMLIRVMRIVCAYDLLTLESTSDKNVEITVAPEQDYDGGHVLDVFSIECRRDGNTVAIMSFDWDALEMSEDPDWYVPFSKLYGELKKFEAESGVDLLSEDWRLSPCDKNRVLVDIELRQDLLWDSTQDKVDE